MTATAVPVFAAVLRILSASCHQANKTVYHIAVLPWLAGPGVAVAVRFLTFAVIEIILVMLFFMNLGSENRGFIKFVVYFMLFELATMNYEWTDSFRLLVFRVTGYTPS